MIKNVIFDFGQVLVRFDPLYMAGRYVSDKEDIKAVASVVFDRLYWDRLDDGTISDEETVEKAKERLPERLHDGVEKAYYNWIYNIPEIEGMREVIEAVKGKGARVFVLSNISRYFAEHEDEIPILKLAEKCIYSAVCGYTKPNADMFAYACHTCEILPEETVFIDDSEKNIRGAEAFGIKGYLFDGDAGRLKAFLETILFQ